MNDLESLSAAFEARYTPAFVKELAARGNPTLKNIPRNENWAGMYLIAGGRKLDRMKDYERVRFPPDLGAMIAACDDAIIRLGSRLEANLSQGARMAKSFAGALGNKIERGGVDGLGIWADRGRRDIALHSCGAVPMALGDDGRHILRVALDGHDGSDDTVPTYTNELEARFGYYANTGPTLESAE